MVIFLSFVAAKSNEKNKDELRGFKQRVAGQVIDFCHPFDG